MLDQGKSVLRFSAFAVAGTGLALDVLSVSLLQTHRMIESELARQLRLKELIGGIIHLDEVLTMSARMAAATGDTAWETRYRSFEPKLDAMIKEAVQIAPSASSADDAAKTDEANLKLVDMEHRSFELVRQQRLPEAKSVLFSTEYETQKQIYAGGMKQLTHALEGEVRKLSAGGQRRMRWSLGMVVVVIPLLLGSWWVVFRVITRWEAGLLQGHRELATLNTVLDQKVAERTAELSKVNEALVAKASELGRFNQIMLGREERVLELKGEVNALCEQLKLAPRYSSTHAQNT